MELDKDFRPLFKFVPKWDGFGDLDSKLWFLKKFDKFLSLSPEGMIWNNGVIWLAGDHLAILQWNCIHDWSLTPSEIWEMVSILKAQKLQRTRRLKV